MTSERATAAACAAAIALSALLGAIAPSPAWTTARAAPEGRPVRIVSLALPADEVLLALVEDRRRIVALEEFADDPRASNVVDEARAIPLRVPLEAEAILALEPDLVILPPWSDTTTEGLLAVEGVPVHRAGSPSSLDDVRAQIRALAAVVGERSRGEALVRAMDARLAAVGERARTHRTRPGVLLWSWSGYSPAAGTLFSDVLAVAGGRDAAGELGHTGFAPLTIEGLLAMDPEAIVLERYRADARAREVVPAPRFEDDPRFASMRAVRGRRVLPIPSAHLVTTSHHVAALAEDLEQALREDGLR